MTDIGYQPLGHTWQKGPGTSLRGSRSSQSAASLLNLVSATLIIIAFLAISGWSILSADEELAETAELSARRWTMGAVIHSEAFDHLVGPSYEILPADQTYFETIARTADVLGFTIYGPDRQALFSLSSDRGAGFAGEMLADSPGTAGVEIIRSEPRSMLPPVMARVSIPLASLGGGSGSIAVLTDQTAAADLFRQEMHVTLLITSILTVIALGNCCGVYLLLRRKRTSDERIFVLAHQDSLTGLANRKQFHDTLASQFPMARTTDERLALHLVDLDGFKAINDTFGHHAGDAVLKTVADQLSGGARKGDLVARLGGDEFAVLQKTVANAGQAEALAARLVDSIRSIRMLDGSAGGVSLSVGTALAPIHAATPEELIKFADIALYRAKETGRDRHVTFVPGMEKEVDHRNLLRLALRQAVEMEEFELYYQPIHRAGDGTIAAFEALVRLPDPSGRLLSSPSDFIPLAETMGLMPRLGRWILKEACTTAALWPEPVPVAVNLSVQQFGEDVVAAVHDAIAASGLPPQRLQLEITESLLVANEPAVLAQLSALKELGVKIVMDDFGTGYSSLSYLWKFPFDKLKVDKSFFSSLEKSEKVPKVLRTISAMTEAMRLTLVAEGIETEDQRDFARRAGYDEMQGFFYGRPMPRQEVANHLSRHASA